MDAMQIRELTHEWPDEAKPRHLTYRLAIRSYGEPAKFMELRFGHTKRAVSDEYVELLFEASGMRWLENGKDSPAFAYPWMDGYTVDYGNGKSFDGTTRLEAISAAILALGPGKKA